MRVVLFYYTLIVMLIVVLSAAVSLSAYLISHKKSELYSCLGLLIYFFDISLVFLDDFLISKSTIDEQSLFFIGNPWLSMLLGAGLVAICWLLVCSYLNESRRRYVIVPTCAYLFVTVSITLFLPAGRLHQFLFYGTRGAMLLCLLLFVTIRYTRNANDITRAKLGHYRPVYFFTLALSVLMLAQNVYFQLMVDYTDLAPLSVWFFPERNFAENTLVVLFAFVATRRALRLLSVRAKQPPEQPATEQESLIIENLDYYAQQNCLSSRESDVLRMVLLGGDNRSIAGTMFLSPSTVKVHVHNILKKTHCPNRKELVLDFWRQL